MIGTERFGSQSGQEPDSESRRLLTELKFGLLSCGLRIGEDARHFMEFAKKPIRTRSGASGGLEVELPYNVFVNVPVVETSGAYSLGVSDGQFAIVDRNGTSCPARLLKAPEYYADRTLDACEDMVRVGQMCSPDRFCYGMTGATCSLWAADDRCRFCSIGLNYQADASSSKTKYLMEVLRRALDDASHPAKHVLLGGGTPFGDDMGACLASELTRQIKQEFDISIYVMICAPLYNEYIDQLYDSGVDELGMNIEFWSKQAWETYIPGKHRRIGKQRYLQALEHAVKRFGMINTRSIIIAGLEHVDDTLKGIKLLASMGVMPIISPFRPLRGTELEHHPTLSAGEYVQLYEAATNACAPYDIPLGPTCIGCQNNTLVMPFGAHYHTYFAQSRNEGQMKPYYRQPTRKSTADLAGPNK